MKGAWHGKCRRAVKEKRLWNMATWTEHLSFNRSARPLFSWAEQLPWASMGTCTSNALGPGTELVCAFSQTARALHWKAAERQCWGLGARRSCKAAESHRRRATAHSPPYPCSPATCRKTRKPAGAWEPTCDCRPAAAPRLLPTGRGWYQCSQEPAVSPVKPPW